MKELNYRPNLAARALITGRSYTVGLVAPDLLHPFFAQVAKALSGLLRQRNYSLIISSSEEDPELEKQEIDRLLAAGWMPSSSLRRNGLRKRSAPSRNRRRPTC